MFVFQLTSYGVALHFRTGASSPLIDQISAELEASRKNSGQEVVTAGETIPGLSEDVSKLLLSAVDEKPSVDVDSILSIRASIKDIVLNQPEKENQKIVITFGTFDLFHIGHLNILRRARELGDRLIVGVSSDEFNYRKKGKKPSFSQEERTAIIGSLKFVDEVFLEESLEKKGEYIDIYKADILVMGDDWAGRFDGIRPKLKTVYLPRTPDISTTLLVERIKAPEQSTMF